MLAIEVGHNQDLVTAAFPDLPVVWLDTGHAEGKVFLVVRDDLPAASKRPGSRPTSVAASSLTGQFRRTCPASN